MEKTTGKNQSTSSSPEISLMVHIDDIGVLPDITDFAFEMMRQGITKTGSIMVPAPDFERTAKKIKANPDLDFGIHITLTNEWQEALPWKPLLSKDEVPSLYNEKGLMWEDERYITFHAQAADVEREMEEQIKTALRNGIKLSHMDAHMFCYCFRKDLFNVALKLAKKYNLAIAVPFPLLPWFTKPYLDDLRRQGYKSPDTFYGLVIENELEPSRIFDIYEEHISNLKPGSHYIFVHVAKSTPETKRVIKDLDIRLKDTQFWTGGEIKELAAMKKINFISFMEFN